MRRCLNCGAEEHVTRQCSGYGPLYPAPGKTADDYTDESQRIMNLVAADIVIEHEEDHRAEHEVLRPDPVRGTD